jgi:hypothetical protein
MRKSALVCIFAGALALFIGGACGASEHPFSDQPSTRTPLVPAKREQLLSRLAQLTVTERRCREFDACETVLAALLDRSVQFIEPILRARNPQDARLKELSGCFNLPLFFSENWTIAGTGSVATVQDVVAEGPVVVYSISDFHEFLVGDGFLVILTGYRTVRGRGPEAPDLIKVIDKSLCHQIGSRQGTGADLFDLGFFRHHDANYQYRIMKYPKTVAVWITKDLLGSGGGTGHFELQ